MVFAMMPLMAETAHAESYDLWVGGIQVTSDNFSGVGNVGGSWEFKPADDEEPAILALDNYKYEGEGYQNAGIFCDLGMENLTIRLGGNNSITQMGKEGIESGSFGISAINLTIEDSPYSEGIGSLNVSAVASDANEGTYGICVSSLAIASGNVTAVAGSARRNCIGIVSDNSVTVSGGSAKASAEQNLDTTSPYYGSRGIYIKDGMLNVNEGAESVEAAGYTKAIDATVSNKLVGKGWTDFAGTENETAISVNAEGARYDNFRTVKFRKTIPLTITAKDQTYTYNGKTQGEGDPAYDDPDMIAEKVIVEGLRGSDYLANVTLNGSASKVGEYPIEVSNAVIKNGETDVTDEYDITYVPGKLTITPVEPKPTPKPTPAKISGTPLTQMTAKGKTGMTIAWEKTKGANGYDIFFSRCNHDDKKLPTKIVATVNGNNVSSWTATGLKAGVTYKACVKAYVMKGGKKQYVKSSPLMHAYTAGASKKHCNAKSVKVNKTNVSIKKGKTFKLKAKVKKLKKGKTLMPKCHVAKVRYLSTDTSIATVSKKGKIKGVKKGTCYVYAYAHNGVFKKVKVTVK